MLFCRSTIERSVIERRAAGVWLATPGAWSSPRRRRSAGAVTTTRKVWGLPSEPSSNGLPKTPRHHCLPWIGANGTRTPDPHLARNRPRS
jgi:hypothetical protein